MLYTFKLLIIDKANLELFVPFTVSETWPLVPEDNTDLDLKFIADSKYFSYPSSSGITTSSIRFKPLNLEPTTEPIEEPIKEENREIN